MKPIARKNDLLIQKEAGEFFIEDLKNDSKMIYLNPTSAYVWERCDGSKSRNDIAIEMGRELGIQVSQEVINLAISKLSQESLLENAHA